MNNELFLDDLEAARDSVEDALAVVDDGDPRRADLYRVLTGLDGVLARISEGAR